MRFFEFNAPPKTVLATSRFVKHLESFAKGHPEVLRALRDFLEFRQTHSAKEPWSRKDTNFTGPMAGYSHVHLVYGRVIVTYVDDGKNIKLYDVTDHSAIDPGRTHERLRDFVVGVGNNFQPFSLATPVKREKTLTPEEKQTVIDLFYEIAASSGDRPLLMQVLKGSWPSDLRDYLVLAVDQDWTDDEKFAAIEKAFGGPEGLKGEIQHVLKTTSIHEAVDNAPRVLILVHPGSACGSADFNLGPDAASARAGLIRDLNDNKGGLIVVDGSLSDELPRYPALAQAIASAMVRAKASGLPAIRVFADDETMQNWSTIVAKRVRNLGLSPDTMFIVTGARRFQDNTAGCVNAVYDTLTRLKYRVRISDNAIDDPSGN